MGVPYGEKKVKKGMMYCRWVCGQHPQPSCVSRGFHPSSTLSKSCLIHEGSIFMDTEILKRVPFKPSWLSRK